MQFNWIANGLLIKLKQSKRTTISGGESSENFNFTGFSREVKQVAQNLWGLVEFLSSGKDLKEFL